MQNIMVFKRVEKKYLLTIRQYQNLMKMISAYIQLDQYGRHTICNIYYDTWQDELARNNFQKPIYKEKLRLRSYGIPNKQSKVFLEIKKKYEGIVYKRRTELFLYEVSDFIAGKHLATNQIEKELNYFIQFYQPIPRLFLAYERRAYYSLDNPELRMTFDENIRSRTNQLDLNEGDMGILLFDESKYLLEIKTNQAYPKWLVAALNQNHIYPASFSKYNNVYEKYYLEGVKNNV